MKSTGIVRKIDELGRLVLPKELRNYLNINPGDNLEIFVDSNKIIMEKFHKLENFEESIDKIISCFLCENKYRIYFSINNTLIKDNSILTSKVQNIINERKIYKTNEICQCKISTTIEDNGRLVINPIVVDSELIGSIIVIGIIDIEYLIMISNVIINLIKKMILFA